MINLRPVFFVIGVFLTILGSVMLLPLLLTLWDADVDAQAFFIPLVITLGTGISLLLCFRHDAFELTSRQMFLLTTLSWLSVSVFSALPLMFLDFNLSYTDAFFEAVSGITTTGSTVLVGLDTLPRSLLLWRALMQWMGGIGIIVMAIAIFPFLKVGGMRLFQTESSDRSEKVFPRTTNIAKAMGSVYLLLSVLCAMAYWAAGMDSFEAIAHAMTTLSTGGYSTSDSSMGQFSQPLIHWIAIVFMILGGLPFVIYIKLMGGNFRSVIENQQLRTFLFFLWSVILILSIVLWQKEQLPFLDALRLAAFNVTSVVTTTGYALTDYTLWGSFAIVAFFFLTFAGACSGSTSGGIKIFRFQIAGLLLRNQLRKLVHPFSVQPVRFGNTILTDEIVQSLVAFSFFFAISVVLLAIALSLIGLDMVTSISGAATAIANVGPGLGDIIGPAGNFASLPDSAKWLLCFGMLLGRLEIMTVLVLFTITFWRG